MFQLLALLFAIKLYARDNIFKGLKMFGEKSPGKMYNVYWYQSNTQTFLFCFFIFTSFDTASPILLVKRILPRDC